MLEQKLEDLSAPAQRLTAFLHPFVAFGIMPVFALANSGVLLRDLGLPALVAPVTLGAALGLLLGKPIGIFALTALAVKLRWAPMPNRARWSELFGVSVIAGIGFTVALFIAALAYAGSAALLDQAKLGILLGSLLAGGVGFALLRGSPPRRDADLNDRPV
jgi:NhaA family Na+:H+ antiporter